ncbi:hypothetical protein GW17_00056073 [Ensete ventricosum]|nr:hypothetical protein GW17_00056073 [Ensete ventricosum]
MRRYLCHIKECSSYRSIPAYRDLAGMGGPCTGTYRPYRAIQGGTENLGTHDPVRSSMVEFKNGNVKD